MASTTRVSPQRLADFLVAAEPQDLEPCVGADRGRAAPRLVNHSRATSSRDCAYRFSTDWPRSRSLERSISRAVTPGTTNPSQIRFQRSRRDADASLVDPRAVSDRRSVTPGTVDATDRSACCSAHRDGTGRPTEASAAESRSYGRGSVGGRGNVYEIVCH